jgi:nucleoside-diphosphate-sugar epimerase
VSVLVTGANGFIGSVLAQHFAAQGMRVIGAMRHPSAAPPKGLARACAWSLGDPATPEMLKGITSVVHLAHDFTPGSEALNFDGTLSLVRAARASGVSYQVYCSSYSAHADARSEYGRTKYRIEAACITEGCAIVRPGLVIGDGGLYRRMARIVAKLPVVPVIGGKSAIAPVVSAADLARCMTALLRDSRPGTFNLFAPDLVKLRDLLDCTARALHVRRMLVPLPAGPLLRVLLIAEAVGLNLPVTSGNVLGLTANQGLPPHSDLGALLEAPMTLGQSIAAALEPEGFGTGAQS